MLFNDHQINTPSPEVLYFSEAGAVRKQNQDNLFVGSCINPVSGPSVSGRLRLEGETVQAVAVFDGMGGEADGEMASLLAAEHLKSFTAGITDLNHRENLRQAAAAYYERFMEALDSSLDDEYAVCGTTCAGVLLQGMAAIPFWMGDSRCYLLRQGQLQLLTKDHSVAQQQIDSGFLTDEEARKTAAWHTLTAYMGLYEGEIVLAERIGLQPGDKIFLCSDGITDVIRDGQLREILQLPPAEAMANLTHIAKTKADDNCTAILLCIAGSESCQIRNQPGRVTKWLRSKLMDMN